MTTEEPLFASWTLAGPVLQSYEREDSFIGVEYTDNVDTRWSDMRLGPRVEVVNCASAGGTAANANGMAIAPVTMQAAGPYGYVIRGTKWAKVKLSDMSLVSDGSETGLAEAATSILYTKSASGVEEISIGMASSAYEVITAVDSDATDTHAANGSSYKARVIALAASSESSGQVAGLGAGTGTVENIAAQNTLTGSTTMASPNWQLRATLSGRPLTFTSFALDRRFWLIGTTDGLYYLNEDYREFQPLIPEAGGDALSCRGMREWSVLGPAVIVPMARSMRRSQYLNGGSIGPETIRLNQSPIAGRCMGFDASELWGYFPYYNPILDQTWLVATRPRGDALEFYTLVKLTNGVESHFVKVFREGRSQHTVAFGWDTDVAWFNEGRTHRFPSDPTYTYAPSGTAYLSELRRYPHVEKVPLYWEFEARDCTSTETITLQVETDGGSAVQVGAPVVTSGMVRIQNNQGIRGRRLKPRLVFARGSTTTKTPYIEGELRMAYTTSEPVTRSGGRRK